MLKTIEEIEEMVYAEQVIAGVQGVLARYAGVDRKIIDVMLSATNVTQGIRAHKSLQKVSGLKPRKYWERKAAITVELKRAFLEEGLNECLGD
jgi:hypothetical protein